MKTVIHKTKWDVFIGLSILIGLYPLVYFFIDRKFGLLSTKSKELLADQFWNIGFYGHIVLGGLALLVGWSQFSSKLRKTRMGLHRTIGKIYMVSVLISGVCGIFIGLNATGGLISSVGFISLGVIWLVSTALAYNAVKNRNIASHENFMIISYAACFSAVTLRIWLPILVILLKDFIEAYTIVAWLCWVPNMIVAYFIISRRNMRAQQVA